MSFVDKVTFELLNPDDDEETISTISMISACFSDREKYSVRRLTEELKPLAPPFYRIFFVAKFQGKIIGGGGVKAIDWASDSHALYLSSVDARYRSRGIGKALVKIRLDWLKENFKNGRVFVSTQKIDRFKQLGFKPISTTCARGRVVLIKEF